MAAPEFDASKPFEPADGPEFDPSKPFESADAVATTAQAAPPTLDPWHTLLAHFGRQATLGLEDKGMALYQALRDYPHDKTGKSFGQVYNNELAQNDRTIDASDAASPGARWLGNGLGFLTSSAALAAPGVLKGAAQATQALPRAVQLAKASAEGRAIGGLVGALGGYGGSRSDSTLGTLANTGLGGLLGYASGAAAPYVADYLGRGSQYLGGKAQDLAGWLKIHSLRPTPVVAERMADIPGGEVEAGKELLARGVGGLTKKGTAKQLDEATSEAGAAIDAMAAAHDASGGPPINITPALKAGLDEAGRLQSQPTSRAAGERLEALVYDYANQYRGQPVPATEALAMKRALADAAYKHGAAAQTGDTVAGDFGKGMAKIERGVDDAMDNALGPKFGAANASFRRLLESGEAATRAAARNDSNHLVGLLPLLAGVGGEASGHGAPAAVGASLATLLAGKYGAQGGARLLYSPVGGGLAALGRGLQALPGAVASQAVTEGAAPYSRSLMDLLLPTSANAAQSGGSR